MGHLPFGYRVGADGKTLEHDDIEWPIVERIGAERGDGLSYGKIAAGLNADGHQTRGRSGRKGFWYPDTVSAIVNRKRNGGDTR